MSIFSGHFCGQIWKVAILFLANWGFCGINPALKVGKSVQIGQICGQLAIFILKVARLEPLIYKGLRANWPDGHFFSYICVRKKFYIINRKMGGQMANRKFGQIFDILLNK